MKEKYERVEITFAKNDEIEMELYEFLKDQSKDQGKAKYLKTLLYREMKKATKK